jgi:hypothetical protein
LPEPLRQQEVSIGRVLKTRWEFLMPVPYQGSTWHVDYYVTHPSLDYLAKET